jgi:iron complex outermembrane receptor protein
MKRIIIGKIIITCFGNKNFLKNGILETTFHLTHGEGYYENYKQDAKFSKYDLPNITENGNTITEQISLEKNG